MKFYKDKKIYNNFYKDKIAYYKLTAIIDEYKNVHFCKNGQLHNNKNYASIYKNSHKKKVKFFYLNDNYYATDFTKESWRRFVKLKVFK